MKSKSYDVPDGLLYTKEHEWATASGDPIRVGITDYAAKTLNDVVYVTLPKAGERVSQFKTMGTVESIKAVSELYSPVTGTVTKVNEALQSHPELVNKSPYGEGWLVEVRAADFDSDRRNLLDSKTYGNHITSLSHK
jgi:glycine cleavage system H protein